MLFAPVLPGETLNNLLLQARVVSDPIRSKLVGWWNEYYFFYVKHRDLQPNVGLAETLNAANDLVAMHLDPAINIADSWPAITQPALYQVAGTGANSLLNKAVTKITESFFRDEGEGWNDSNGGPAVFTTGIPLVRIGQENFADSFANDADRPGAADVEIEVDAVPAPDVVYASEIDRALATYQFLRENDQVQMSFEQFLQTHGVRTAKVEDHKPELLRYIRDWTYPSSTVNPETGAVTSVVSWSPVERADKNRFFAEPGYIVGLTCCRPKVYFGLQDQLMANFLNFATDWLPAILRPDPWNSYKQFAQGTGPFPHVTDAGGYWIDVRDLFIHGEQFVNFDVDGDDNNNAVALPSTTGARRYPLLADAKNLFVDETADVLTRIRQDGIVTLQIASMVRDEIRPTV